MFTARAYDEEGSVVGGSWSISLVERDKEGDNIAPAWVGKITSSKDLSTSTFTFPTVDLSSLSQSTCAWATFKVQCVIDGVPYSTEFSISTSQL